MRRFLLVLACSLPLGLFLAGWKAFRFLTDDAFIAFRYVSNAMLGHGYVWNAPPFLPVEGYTSFLWILLLEFAWRLFGVEPPQSANWLALAFALGSFALIARAALRLPMQPTQEKWRALWVGLLLLACASNRTWLAWASSGLETAMFNFWLLAWLYLAFFARVGAQRILLGLSACATLIALSRPDGLLFVAATIAIAVFSSSGISGGRRALGSTPLLVVIAHLLWRRSFYGEWLPNTYVAKSSGIWLDAGMRYALSFVLEYAYWIPLVIGLYLLVQERQGLGAKLRERPREGIALLTVGAHVGYYTFFVGGDHFEYRVYSYLVPVLALAFAARLLRSSWKPRALLALFVLWLLCAQPIPWIHWQRSRQLTTRADTAQMTVPVADAFPSPLRPGIAYYDEIQAWLIEHFVCARHQEHKVFVREQQELLPSREEGLLLPADGNPLARMGAVGVPAWVLPKVHILDSYGLNDWLVARNPSRQESERRMAHDRRCPPIYANSYMPNLSIVDRRAVISDRARPLDDATIAQLERQWREWVMAKRRIVEDEGWDAWSVAGRNYLPEGVSTAD